MSVNYEAAELLVWPDGYWCWANEGPGYTKSDDYLTIVLPDYADDDTAENIAVIVQKHGFVSEEQIAQILEQQS